MMTQFMLFINDYAYKRSVLYISKSCNIYFRGKGDVVQLTSRAFFFFLKFFLYFLLHIISFFKRHYATSVYYFCYKFLPACKENFEVLEILEAHKPSNSRGYGVLLTKREIVIRLFIKTTSLTLY